MSVVCFAVVGKPLRLCAVVAVAGLNLTVRAFALLASFVTHLTTDGTYF